MQAAHLRSQLDKLLLRFSDEIYVTNDPLGEVKKFKTAADREVASFVASGFAFGNIKSIMAHLRKIWKIIGSEPAEFAKAHFHNWRSNPFENIKYRWITPGATSALFHVLGEMLRSYGSLERFFASSGQGEMRGKLQSFCERAVSLSPEKLDKPDSRGLKYFFSPPGSGSACKRLNLFLRWVVRKDSPDLGLWSEPAPSELVIPLDVHVARAATALGLTRRKSKRWKTAQEITESLLVIDPQDPLKYDFALHKIGVAGGDASKL